MCVYYDKQAKHYVISYQYKDSFGNYKTKRIQKMELFNKVIGFDISDLSKKEQKKTLQNFEFMIIQKIEAIDKSTISRPESFSSECDAFVQELYGTLKKQTAYGYELVVNKYIKPNFINNLSIDKALTIESITAFKRKISALKDISAKRKNRILTTLKNLIEYSSKLEHISQEFEYKSSKILTHLTTRNEVKSVASKDNFWTPTEYENFIKTFSNYEETSHAWKVLFDVAYYGALRVGELLGLQWQDINLATNKMTIQRTIDFSGQISTTKNLASQATITLPKSIVEELIWLKEKEIGQDKDFVFFVKKTSRTSIRRVMDEHIELANVKHITIHGLRHSFASRAIDAGWSPLLVSKHMRHASPQQTLDTYSHLFEQSDEELMNSLSSH
ncbi:MAG: site-specific integrase [Bacilli bacterium]|nr:site-specific integrase [Bacilli bacterium]